MKGFYRQKPPNNILFFGFLWGRIKRYSKSGYRCGEIEKREAFALTQFFLPV